MTSNKICLAIHISKQVDSLFIFYNYNYIKFSTVSLQLCEYLLTYYNDS